jgi:chromosome segregation ATPase
VSWASEQVTQLKSQKRSLLDERANAKRHVDELDARIADVQAALDQAQRFLVWEAAQ